MVKKILLLAVVLLLSGALVFGMPGLLDLLLNGKSSEIQLGQSTLTPEETFAVNAASGKMRLANYSVELDGGACSLVVKRNDPKIKLSVGKEGQGAAHIRLVVTAGLVDYSKAVDVDKIKDVGDVPDGAFAAAEKKLAAEISSAYEKARGVGCDLFGLTERLVKYKNRAYRKFLDGFLSNTTLSVEVKFVGVR